MGSKLLSSSLIQCHGWWLSGRTVEAGEGNSCQIRRWAGREGRRYCASLHLQEAISNTAVPLSPPLFLLADNLDLGYSQASYYTSLGLFIISVPGLWSLIKRSVKSKVTSTFFFYYYQAVSRRTELLIILALWRPRVRAQIVVKTFTTKQGEGSSSVRPNQMAGEILSFFSRNNFTVLDRGDTITFEGMMVPSRSQAALLVFCTCISLASVALVLTITFPDIGNNWFYLTLLSPLAGAYYWTRASRKEQIKVKIMLADDGSLSEIIVQGDDQQVDEMRRELQLNEKGMIYVKGIFER